VLSYDVPHRRPWDWRVSLYTWTKGIAAGAYLVVLALALAGALDWRDDLWRWGAPLLGGAFLALTGAVLIWDLEHPRRFLYIFTRPQWRSWLVRGAYVIAGYSAVLTVHFAASVAGFEAPQRWLAIAGAPLAGMTAVYTGYLFAQAKARDLWQDPLLVPHLLVQAALAGAAAALVAATALGSPTKELEWILVAAALAHLLMVAAQASTTHATAHAALASHELTRGRYGRWYWAGAVLVTAAAVAPWLGVAAAPLALAGLLAHEHAYVQAGQAVPLA
jgi:formate-dependent nitrite reductase membrane component NrfD